MARSHAIGVVLAGGAARRLGGAGKADLEVAGRPLAVRAVEALRAGVGHAVVVAKASTVLPASLDAEVWLEPAEPRHPLVGVRAALERAGSRSIVVLAVDLPLVTPEVLGALASCPAPGALAVAARAPGGPLEPLLARYEPGALAVLRDLDAERTSMRVALAALAPAAMDADPAVLLNVNEARDLATAEAALSRRSPTSSAPAGRSPAR